MTEKFKLPTESFLRAYNAAEQAAVERDLNNIRIYTFDGRIPPKSAPEYMATAGSPSTGKTTLIEQILVESRGFENHIYIDPDVFLRLMTHTHQRDLSAYATSRHVYGPSGAAWAAYNKWRGASNFIANTLFNEALESCHDIAHGSTMTGENSGTLLDEMKRDGRRRTLLLSFSDEKTRRGSLAVREAQGIINVTPEEFALKAIAFVKKLPLYRDKAEQLMFFWRDDIAQDARLAADAQHSGVIVHDQAAFDAIRSLYEDQQLAHSLPSWQTLFKGNGQVGGLKPRFTP